MWNTREYHVTHALTEASHCPRNPKTEKINAPATVRKVAIIRYRPSIFRNFRTSPRITATAYPLEIPRQPAANPSLESEFWNFPDLWRGFPLIMVWRGFRIG